MVRSQFIVAQLGARMHYAVPRILYEAGSLQRLYTDFSAAQGWPALLSYIPHGYRPKGVQRLLGRVAKGLPDSKVAAFNLLGIRYTQKLRQAQSPKARSEAFLWSGKEFCRRVLKRGWDGAHAVYTFNTAGLEILRAACRDGLRTFTEQTIAPKQTETQLLEVERNSYPDWERDRGIDPFAGEIADRELAEWETAETILCASEFVREGIQECGGPIEKCVVVPYGVDGPEQKAEGGEQEAESQQKPPCSSLPRNERLKNRPLRVLTVGAVGLRKGSPYVLETAKRLKNLAEFRMVGPIGVTQEAEAELRKHLELYGPVPRSEVAGQFSWADVFLMPSICEGSATVIYEALSHGLPIICTPNTGSVVRDGEEGFIVPIRDSQTTAIRLTQLVSNPDLCSKMASNARRRALNFTVAAYGDRLLAVLKGNPQTVV